jgi:hypothetical protein
MPNQHVECPAHEAEVLMLVVALGLKLSAMMPVWSRAAGVAEMAAYDHNRRTSATSSARFANHPSCRAAPAWPVGSSCAC